MTTPGLQIQLQVGALAVAAGGRAVANVGTPIAAVEAIYWCMAHNVAFAMGASPNPLDVQGFLSSGPPRICILHPHFPPEWFYKLSALKIGHQATGTA